MSRTFVSQMNENKVLFISVLAVVAGLLMRSCGSDFAGSILPMCGSGDAALISVAATHTHCMGCFVAAASSVFAALAVVSKAIRPSRPTL